MFKIQVDGEAMTRAVAKMVVGLVQANVSNKGSVALVLGYATRAALEELPIEERQQVLPSILNELNRR